MKEKTRCVKNKNNKREGENTNMSEEEQTTMREGEKCNNSVREGKVATSVTEHSNMCERDNATREVNCRARENMQHE